MIRSIQVVAFAALVAILGGCATNQQVSGGRFTLPETIAPEDGIVLVKLIGVQPLSAFNTKWRTLRVVNQAGVYYEVQDTAPGTASYSLFLGTLPKGQYRISQLESFGQAPGLLLAALTTDSKDVSAQFSSFTIQPGAVTNLGTAVFALSADGKGPPIKTVVLADESGRSAANADVDARSQPKLQGRQSLTWDKLPEGSAAADALAIVRKHAVNLSPMQKTSKGQIMAGGALGLIHERGADGKWASTSIGELDTITYIRELDDGRVFAGTDSGRYYLRQPGQQAWQRFNLPDRDVAVTHLEPVGDAGYVIQVALHGPPSPLLLRKYSFFFKAKLEDAGTEKLVLSFDEASAMGNAPTFFDGEELLVYFNHIGIARRADLHRINPRTLAKRTEQVSYWVKDIYRLPDGTLFLDRMNAMSAYASFSRDNGKTWEHGETAGPHTVRFTSPKLGYGFSTAATGWSTVTVAFNKTEDGGKSWAQVGSPAVASGRMSILPLDQGGVVVFTGIKILSTQDEGRTWRTEWPAD